ncbi:hypothetical protein [Natranaeroarchaeum aerophilus]|uniref:Uncharacterized protein n=1 Tax=Natranaeroarchaeum aerophilus TaxID=2917711 RepID=A0AAE3FRD4_9EURY|nr:hypothetical protein [Natranaeroarchaeum aerophilus]MCL9813938.1 hypothetical protein [Natranaeroarchaeum aerophilus]
MEQQEDILESLFNDNRLNAIIGWTFVAILGIVLLESVLDLDLQWIAFTAATAGIVLVPPVVHRSPYVMLPWELLLLATLPIVVRALELSALSNTFATYLSIAALALIVTVELHLLTWMRITDWFAVVLTVTATLAAAGLWTILRYNMDVYLGTEFLTTNEALMIEWIWVTLAGIVAGVMFNLYFRPRSRRLRRKFGQVMRR